MDVIHFEHDGSLSDYGVEIITQPCSLRYHQECVGWSKLCKAVTEQGYSSHYQDGCGLHIHVNRGSMSVMDIVKADVFANRAMALFSQLGRREEFYSSRYLTKRIARLGVACQSQDLYDLHKKGMPRDMAAKYTSFSYGRYTAVNTTNPDTVEFRFMKGSLNPNTVLGTIEMVDGICEYMKYIPLSEIYATEKNIKGYLDFMFAHKDKYTSFPAMAGRLVKSGSCAKIVRKLLNKDASCYDLRQVQNHGREV